MAQPSLAVLCRGQVATGPTTVYTVPAGSQVLIKSIVVSNQSGTPTITVNVVPSGGSAAASNAIINALATVANAITVYSNMNIVMNAGDFISLACSAATVNCYISGVVYDGSTGMEATFAF